jgi:plasmid stability protein
MATLSIRNLSDEVHRRLRVRAAEHGRSMEAEARAILEEVCDRRDEPLSKEEIDQRVRRLQDYAAGLSIDTESGSVVDDLIAERRREAAREEQD